MGYRVHMAAVVAVILGLAVPIAVANIPVSANPEDGDSPTSTDCLQQLKLGYEALDAGDPATALSHYQNAHTTAESTPLKVQALLGLGASLSAMGRLDEARSSFEEASRLAPTDADVWYSLASFYAEVGEQGLAIETLDQAVAVAPDFAPAQYDRCVLLEAEGRHADAAAACLAAVSADSNHSSAWLGLAVARFHLTQYKDAATAFENVLQIEPDNARASYGLGLSYLYDGRTDDATAEYVRLKPLDADLARDLYLRIIE